MIIFTPGDKWVHTLFHSARKKSWKYIFPEKGDQMTDIDKLIQDDQTTKGDQNELNKSGQKRKRKMNPLQRWTPHQEKVNEKWILCSQSVLSGKCEEVPWSKRERGEEEKVWVDKNDKEER